MGLESGKRVGPYEIASPLGTGGMGEVYRARDTRLDRMVALKVLRPDLAGNAEALKRFEREARVVSSLAHPHVCALYDVGRVEGVDFLVMELLEGETLAQRLARGPLPFDDVLKVGLEIAAALDAAHRKGIVHRDLKPSNIMLTRFGAKLMDFGLARLRPGVGEAASTGHSQMPTAMQPLTGEQRVLGTIPYMAPEQIEGREGDARSDLFAVGVVLYEMTTRRHPFAEKSPASTMAAILKSDPVPPGSLRPELPAPFESILLACLKKDPDERWQSAHDLALQLESIREARQQHAHATRVGEHRWIAWSVAGIASIAALALGLALMLRPSSDTPGHVVRFSFIAPEGTSFVEPYWSPPSLAPDGSAVAFVARSGPVTRIWVHAIDALESRPLPGTEGGLAPFWSPDSRTLAFFADGKLKVTPAVGGAVRTVCDAGGPACGAWGDDGMIVFGLLESPGNLGLFRVPEAGGAPQRLRLQDERKHELLAGFPRFIPDAHKYLFLGASDPSYRDVAIYLSPLDAAQGSAVRRLPPPPGWKSRVEYGTGFLLGVSEGSLLAQRLDGDAMRLEGRPLTIAQNVGSFGIGAAFSVSQNGVLAYRPAGVSESQLAWLDRSGKMIGPIGAPADYSRPSISPDGRRLAIGVNDARTGLGDIWVFQFPQNTSTRLTSEAVDEFRPVWSSDGREILYSSGRDGLPHLFRMSAGGGSPSTVIAANGHVQWAGSWSTEGRQIVYTDRDPETGMDVWSASLDGEGRPAPILRTKFQERDPCLSPDGRWIAYVSDESGRFEVYVQRFPSLADKQRVSTDGGWEPHWRADGKEIFYMAWMPKPGLIAVEMNPMSPNPAGAPRTLFELNPHMRDFDVAGDGQRFLINYDTEATVATPMIMVINWNARPPGTP